MEPAPGRGIDYPPTSVHPLGEILKHTNTVYLQTLNLNDPPNSILLTGRASSEPENHGKDEETTHQAP